MTPNQLIALAVAAVSAFMWYQNQQTADEDLTDDTVPQPKPDKKRSTKDTPFVHGVKTRLDACPYADDTLKLKYLKEGTSVDDIVSAEMHRLGKGK